MTVNLADAFSDKGKTVLLVDADPQCNLTSFYIDEDQLEALLGDSDNEDSADTLWSAIKPVVVNQVANRLHGPRRSRAGRDTAPAWHRSPQSVCLDDIDRRRIGVLGRYARPTLERG